MTTTLLERTETAIAQESKASGDKGGKYLTFKLANEEYGVEVLKVREIMGLIDITSVPQMPPHMKGVINLRGKVIPVVHLRLKFGLHEIEPTEQTCIIVDRVSEVLDITGDSIEPPPAMGAAVDTSFILGMGKVGEAVKILLDVEKVLSGDELMEIEAAAEVDCPPSPGTAASSACARKVAPASGECT